MKMNVATGRAEAAYFDPATGAKFPIDEPRWCSNDGAPLMITPCPGLTPSLIHSSVRSLWRYAESLPVAVPNPITLGEGCTPLVSRRVNGHDVLLKLEWFAPSGSFKDRGASVMMSVLRQQGIDRVLEDSSGNGGAAIAAYAAAGGMRAKILVPASTPEAKTVQMRAYGAEIELVPGVRQDTADEAVRQSSSIFYASHNWQPFFLQGTKTLAYELWEDLGFSAPDNVIIPMGAGSNVLGCDIGFSELLGAGEIDRLPRLFGVQPSQCAPIHAAFLGGGNELVPTDIGPTMAEGTAITRPVRLREVLDAIRRSSGSTVAVTEAEIEAALWALASQGLYAEPTSALAVAAFNQLIASGIIRSDQSTVLVMTSTGLKVTQRINDMLQSAR
jgi:threonine synthase